MTISLDDIEIFALGRQDPPADSIPPGVPGDELERIQKWRAGNRGGFAAKEADNEAELSIIGVIGGGWLGDGISASSVKRWVDANKNAKSIRVLVDSPGGDYFDGVAIMNLLKRHAANVTVEVIGEASSAASVIAMAGDSIEMHAGTVMMVHRAWTIAMGNGDDLRSSAGMLDAIDDNLGAIYAGRTGKARAEVDKLVAATTNMSAGQAVAEGFADREVPAKKKTAPAPAPAKGARAQARASESGTGTEPPTPAIETPPKTPPAPEARQISPVSGEEQRDMTLPKTLITVLNLAEDADENAAVAAINKLKTSASLGSQIELQLGVTGPAAIGAVRALQEEREANKTLSGEVAKLKIVNARREFDGLIERGKTVTKNLTAFGVKGYTQQFEDAAKLADGEGGNPDDAAEKCANVCASLKGYLAMAPRFGSDARQVTNDDKDATSSFVTHNGKRLEELTAKEQHALKKASPEKYDAMRTDALERKAI